MLPSTCDRTQGCILPLTTVQKPTAHQQQPRPASREYAMMKTNGGLPRAHDPDEPRGRAGARASHRPRHLPDSSAILGIGDFRLYVLRHSLGLQQEVGPRSDPLSARPSNTLGPRAWPKSKKQKDWLLDASWALKKKGSTEYFVKYRTALCIAPDRRRYRLCYTALLVLRTRTLSTPNVTTLATCLSSTSRIGLRPRRGFGALGPTEFSCYCAHSKHGRQEP